MLRITFYFCQFELIIWNAEYVRTYVLPYRHEKLNVWGFPGNWSMFFTNIQQDLPVTQLNTLNNWWARDPNIRHDHQCIWKHLVYSLSLPMRPPTDLEGIKVTALCVRVRVKMPLPFWFDVVGTFWDIGLRIYAPSFFSSCEGYKIWVPIACAFENREEGERERERERENSKNYALFTIEKTVVFSLPFAQRW